MWSRIHINKFTDSTMVSKFKPGLVGLSFLIAHKNLNTVHKHKGNFSTSQVNEESDYFYIPLNDNIIQKCC